MVTRASLVLKRDSLERSLHSAKLAKEEFVEQGDANHILSQSYEVAKLEGKLELIEELLS